MIGLRWSETVEEVGHSFAISQFADHLLHLDRFGGDGIVISGTSGEIGFGGERGRINTQINASMFRRF